MIDGIYQGKQKIPNYKQWLKNQQGNMENIGAKLVINEDGSATLTMNGKSATQPESALKERYDQDVKRWIKEGFEF